jgi:hypothetical protein
MSIKEVLKNWADSTPNDRSRVDYLNVTDGFRDIIPKTKEI